MTYTSLCCTPYNHTVSIVTTPFSPNLPPDKKGWLETPYALHILVPADNGCNITFMLPEYKGDIFDCTHDDGYILICDEM